MWIGCVFTQPVKIRNRYEELTRDDADEEEAAVASSSATASAAPATRNERTKFGSPRKPMPTLSLLDDEQDDLCTTEDYEYVMVEGILDSGSVAHVMDKHEAPGYKVNETAASRRGQMYTGAGGEKIANEGEMDLNLLAENGHTGRGHELRCKVQAAKVTRPLFSVGKICDNGIDVLFRKGYAATIDAKTGKEITRHPRENGTYRFKAKLRSPKIAQPETFHRQGA